MKFAVLGSGSEGNSLVIRNGFGALLIDAGFSVRRLFHRLEILDIDPSEIRALCLTHEHIDHIRGAGILARKLNIPLFATEGTLHGGRSILGTIPDVRVIGNSDRFDVAGLEIRAFSLSHDACDPVGFLVSGTGGCLGVCTDLGHVTHLVKERLKGCKSLIVETNHDANMLLAGPYPWKLKQRIRSRHGHLSNEDGAALLKAVWHENLRHVCLAHLSGENNLPDLAKMAVRQALDAVDANGHTRITVARQDHPTKLIGVDEIPEDCHD